MAKTMTHTQKLIIFHNELFDALVDAGSQRYYLIDHPTPERGEDVEVHRNKVEQLAKNWCEKVRLETGTPDFVRILMTEVKKNGSFFFHIVMGGCDWGKFKKVNYCFRWYEETTGGATEQRFELGQLRGLLHFLVMKLDCPIDVSKPFLSRKARESYAGIGEESLFDTRENRTYRRADFL
jgi:hypothetical protein